VIFITLERAFRFSIPRLIFRIGWMALVGVHSRLISFLPTLRNDHDFLFLRLYELIAVYVFY
jgi:hypothetical protein